jgi:hypothetical protein
MLAGMFSWLKNLYVEVRPNARWDFIKWAAWGLLAVIGTLITALVQRWQGIPYDLVGVLIIGFVWLFILGLVFLATKLRSVGARPQKHEETERSDEGQYSGGWIDTIVDYQRRGLRKYVLVEKCEVSLAPLIAGKPYFELTFHVRNYSMFYVSIPMAKYDPVKGTIRFKGDPISGNAKLTDNQVTNLEPYGRNYFKVWQWVNNPDEAKEIPATLEKVGNLFDFSETVIPIKADRFPDDSEAKLDLTRGMQNAELENRVIQLEALHGQRALESAEWQKYTDIIYRLNLVYGMALQVDYTIGFPGHTPLPKEILDYLKAHIDSAIHQCLGASVRDSYFEHVQPVPDGDEGQESWIRSHCSMLDALIQQQHRQLVARKATTEHL